MLMPINRDRSLSVKGSKAKTGNTAYSGVPSLKPTTFWPVTYAHRRMPKRGLCNCHFAPLGSIRGIEANGEPDWGRRCQRSESRFCRADVGNRDMPKRKRLTEGRRVGKETPPFSGMGRGFFRHRSALSLRAFEGL